jgi:hypothetical protein
MPIQQCEVDGKTGWQFNDGTCYVGRNSRRKAKKDQELYEEAQADLMVQADKIICEQAHKKDE